MWYARSDALSPPTSTATTCTSQTPTSTRHSYTKPLPSPPSTPRHHLKSPAQSRSPSHLPGLLTPVSSIASLSPRSSAHKDGRNSSTTPAVPHYSRTASGRRYNHSQRQPALTFANTNTTNSPRRPSLRTSFQPHRPSLSLDLHLRPALSSMAAMTGMSRATSPQGRQRALSPTRPPISRPPSRCESLLRDTLRKAEEHDRHPHSSESRSPASAAVRRGRSRGNSIRAPSASKAHVNFSYNLDDNISDFEYIGDAGMFSADGRGTMDFLQRVPPPTAGVRIGRGATVGSPPDASHFHQPYGSPSSPTPPSMLRTRTAPVIPRASSKAQAYDVDTTLCRPPYSPARHTLPNLASTSSTSSNVNPTMMTTGSSSSSNGSSPRLRAHSVSPHEAVLRAKLESVLRGGPGPSSSSSPPDERDVALPATSVPARTRHHQRAYSHGVTVGHNIPGHEDPAGMSPQSFTTSSLSNSISDLARQQHPSSYMAAIATATNATPSHHRRHTNPSSSHKAGSNGSSPSSPEEPMTPPATPPFNARTASEVCKRMDGYVSFANVEGLGEPPGLDMDGEDGEDGSEGKRWGRWLRLWPFANGESHGHMAGTPATGGDASGVGVRDYAQSR